MEQKNKYNTNMATKRTRYPYVWVSARQTKMSECILPPIVDTVSEDKRIAPVVDTGMRENDRSVPLVNTSTEGVRYPQNESPRVSPEEKKVTENLSVIKKNVEEVDEKKEILDFIKYVVTSLNMLNLRLLDLKVIKLNITSTSLLQEITDLILQQALVRTKYVSQYAKLCATMVHDNSFNKTPRDSNKTFKDVLEQKLKQLFEKLKERSTTSMDEKKLSAFYIFINELKSKGALSDNVAEQFTSVSTRRVSSERCRSLWGIASVVDTVMREDDRSVPLVNTSTEGVRYPQNEFPRVSPKENKIVECLPTVIDTENDCGVPVVNTATEGVRYPHIWVSTTGTKMPEHLPPVLVTMQKGVRSVWSPEPEEVIKVTENVPVIKKNVEEVDEKKEILDFIKYVVTSLNMLNLRLLDLKVIKLNITSTLLLQEITDLILQQALVRTKYVSQYAKLCATMVHDNSFNKTPRDSNETFNDVLEQKLKQLFEKLKERSTTSMDEKKLSAFSIFINELKSEGALSDNVAEQFTSVSTRRVSSERCRSLWGRNFPKRSA